MIYTYPHKILLTPSVDVKDLNEAKEIDKLLREEMANITWGECVGLAAPQIGLNKNVFIAMGKTYINPVISFYGPHKEIKKEGCYSLEKRKYDYEVERSKSIKITWVNTKGKVKEGFFMGLQAQILQHEYDHLLGKLCSGND